jgi:hypothetical protein
VRIPSPTREAMVIATPRIPGLELHLPANTTIRDRDGRIVREISLTKIPVDQPPFPLPAGVETPVYFTAQPGGAYIHTAGYGPKGASLVYPGGPRLYPGDEVNFWHYDPEQKGWHVYGLGQVTLDGRQVRPNPGVSLYAFTGAMIGAPWTPGPPGSYGPPDSDPVDLSTGQFVMEKTDLVVQDVIPLVLTRTYYSGDSGARPFGIGSTFPYAMFLWSANQYTEVDLILPTGKRIHYVRTSGGRGFQDAVFEHTASPTAFFKSVIDWNGNGAPAAGARRVVAARRERGWGPASSEQSQRSADAAQVSRRVAPDIAPRHERESDAGSAVAAALRTLPPGCQHLSVLAGPHPRSRRLDSLRSLAAAAGARRQRQPADIDGRTREGDDLDLRRHSLERERSASRRAREWGWGPTSSEK